MSNQAEKSNVLTQPIQLQLELPADILQQVQQNQAVSVVATLSSTPPSQPLPQAFTNTNVCVLFKRFLF